MTKARRASGAAATASAGWCSPQSRGWFLWTEHRAHLLGFLPYAFLLACPLMHVFMHHGHGHGSHHGHGGGGSGAPVPPRVSDEPNPGDRS